MEDYRCSLRLKYDNPQQRKAIDILENRDRSKYKDKVDLICESLVQYEKTEQEERMRNLIERLEKDLDMWEEKDARKQLSFEDL